MNDIVSIQKIKPIPSRSEWLGWLEDLQKPGASFLSGHLIQRYLMQLDRKAA